MKKVCFVLTVFALAMLSIQSVMGQTVRRERLDSLNRELSAKKTLKDSVRVMYDIFDLSFAETRASDGEKLLAAAKRLGNLRVQFDVMRRLAMIYGDDDVYADRYDAMINDAASMPKSPEQRETLAFLRIQNSVASNKSSSVKERQKKVHQMINSLGVNNGGTTDPYDRIEFLFVITRYLQYDMNSDLLARYVDELSKQINDLNSANRSLYHLYALQASKVFTVANQIERGIEANKEVLKMIDDMEVGMREEGRQFRNYDNYRYATYRRMLILHKGLTDKELDHYYAQLMELVRTNEDIQHDYDSTQRPEIYYLIAKKRYREVLEILKKQIDNPQNVSMLHILYPDMIEAATALNDREALLKASLGYNKFLANLVTDRSDERTYEIDMLDKMHNELTDMSGSRTEIINQQRATSEQYHHTLLTFTIVATIVLLSVIALLLYLYSKSRRLSSSISKSNEELIKERDTLQRMQLELIEARDHARRADRHKTEFVNNMSHEVRTPLNALLECSHILVDNLPEGKRQYLQRYANMIDVSADMIQSIVNDVLEIASLDNQQARIQRKAASVNSMCTIAVDSMRKHCADGVEMKYLNADSDDITVMTDDRRVEQVLINLLSNGCKFTEHGHVYLYYTVNPSDQTISFVIEDTGIGVPKGKEEIIFERFEKLSNLTSGTGLGLNISRMVASLLGGTVKVDTSYDAQGARFVFTIPL